MPATTCLLCRGPLHLSQEDLKLHRVPMVGYDCRAWLNEGLGIDTIQGVAFNLEQMIMVYCLEAAVEAGYVGKDARNEAERMIGAAINQIQTRYAERLKQLPTEAPISAALPPRAERVGTDFFPPLT